LYTNACICEYDDSNMSPQEKGHMDWSLLCVVTSVLWLDECGEQGVIQKACSCDLDVLCNKDPVHEVRLCRGLFTKACCYDDTR
jgi:hypothetical protein